MHAQNATKIAPVLKKVQNSKYFYFPKLAKNGPFLDIKSKNFEESFELYQPKLFYTKNTSY